MFEVEGNSACPAPCTCVLYVVRLFVAFFILCLVRCVYSQLYLLAAFFTFQTNDMRVALKKAGFVMWKWDNVNMTGAGQLYMHEEVAVDTGTNKGSCLPASPHPLPLVEDRPHYSQRESSISSPRAVEKSRHQVNRKKKLQMHHVRHPRARGREWVWGGPKCTKK